MPMPALAHGVDGSVGTGSAALALLLGVAAVAVALLALATLLLRAVLAGLPRRPALAAVGDEQLTSEMRDAVDEFERAGFRRVGPARRMAIPATNVLVPLLHGTEPVFATVMRIEHGSVALVAWDCVSMLRRELCGLTTVSDPAGTVAPGWPGAFRQVFAGARPTALLQHHLDGAAFLQRSGLPARPIAAGEFEDLIALSFRLQRHVFLRAPVRNLVRCLWRTATRCNPYVGALAEQAGVPAQLAALRDGVWPDARARDALGAEGG